MAAWGDGEGVPGTARWAAGGTFGGFGSTETDDCQDRALRTGQFANVEVQFAPTLRN